jgi:hypothetical protein
MHLTAPGIHLMMGSAVSWQMWQWNLPFTDPDQYDVSLGGRRCNLKSFLISHRGQISQMRDGSSRILNAPALIPSDHFSMDGYSDNDLHVFAFLSGLIAASQDDLKKVNETYQPCYLIHAMPAEWRKPSHWNPLGPLVLKSESDADMLAEISGQDEARGFLTRLVNLPAKTRITVNHPFYSVNAIHIKNIPSERLGIHSPAIKETHLISPMEWGNLWVYGIGIILTGFISRREFRQRANLVAPNSRVFQYDHTKIKKPGCAYFRAATAAGIVRVRAGMESNIVTSVCIPGSRNPPGIDHEFARFSPCLITFKVIL